MTETITGVAIEPRPLLLAGVPTTTSESVPVVFPYDGSEVATGLGRRRRRDRAGARGGAGCRARGRGATAVPPGRDPPDGRGDRPRAAGPSSPAR